MDYKPILSFDSYITANLYLAKLQSEDINCYLKDEFSATINPVFSNAIGGIKLCVWDSDWEKAIAILKEFTEEQKQNQKCLNCNGTNVQYVSKPYSTKNKLFALITWLLSSFAISNKNVYHCYDCGYEFDEIPVQE